MEIREAREEDLIGLLHLYTYLHDNKLPEISAELMSLWRGIIEDEHHHILIGTIGGRVVTSCVLVIIQNLTHDQRPYALIENVVTEERHRNRGYASTLLSYAKETARRERCYKIMLMTGSKLDSTLWFYEQAGFNRTDKTAFIQWIE
jgi:GNAT superfamily N-acetyltransferase